jgi:hypothetical protein
MVYISKQEFGEFIRKLRLGLNPPVTLRGFAEKVGISPTYLSKIERGDFDPPAEDTIVRIAKELKCNEDELLGMAGKISSDVASVIINKPVLAAQFLRTSKSLTKKEWESLITQAEKFKKGDN